MPDSTKASIQRDVLLRKPLADLLKEQALELPEAEEALKELETTGSAAGAERYVKACIAWTHSALEVALRSMYEEAFARAMITPRLRRVGTGADSESDLEVNLRHGLLRVEQKCLQAPFTAWRELSKTKGVTLALVSELRELAQELGVESEPLTSPRLQLETLRNTLVHPSPTAKSSALLTQLIMYALMNHVREHGHIETVAEIKNTLDLSATDLGRIFGITRQAVDQWMEKDVPPSRAADVERVGDVVRFLRKKFKVDRLPQVVRNKVPALGGQSMLEILQENGAPFLHDYLRAAFSYQLGC